MKNGFLTSEFISSLGPYGIALALLYMGFSDAEVQALIQQAVSGLSPAAQAVVQLIIKAISLGGAALVGMKAADTSKSYNAGRVQQKLANINKQDCK
jgi:hypothetical protein